jgi:zinc protease
MRALVDLFQIKLDETLREQLGGTYSPSVGGSCARTPRQEYTVVVQFNSAPENVDKLSKSVFALIDSLKANGPSASDVDKVKEQLTREREVEVKQNSYWLVNLIGRDQSGEDIGGLLDAYDAMVKNLTGPQIQQAAAKYFNEQNYARFVLLPENSKSNP